MSDLVERARSAKRESKQIEFKSSFDPTSNGEWCEVIKDIVAIANSGGGIIIFGVNNDGSLSGLPVEAIGRIDPADIANRISKYTGCIDPPVEIIDIERQGSLLPAFIIQSSATPLVFENPGTYDVGAGKQKTAFGRGTIYYRHVAKSEPGTTEDIRFTFERNLNQIRNSWLKQVKKVVKAPAGAQFIVQTQVDRPTILQSNTVRIVNGPKGIPVILTRDPTKGGGTYLHEEVSEGIFDEINNVVDANRILTKGQTRFFLGPQVYYRVYAERQHIRQDQGQMEMLFHAGACEFYAPNLFWALELDADLVAKYIVATYLAPKSPQIHWFMRMAVLLGAEFCNWIYQRWDRKWHNYSQPPTFYFSFDKLIKDFKDSDQRLLATHSSPTTKLTIPGQTEASCSELMQDPRRADALLSAACMAIFEGNSQLRSTARALDYFAHGLEIVQNGKQIAEAAITAIGDKLPGDFEESSLVD
jgi:hypothetical protein